MTSYICSYCNKTYKRKSAFNNHQINCELIRICSKIKTKNEEDQELNIKFNGNINDLYKLFINLYNKFEKLETDYNELKNYANVKKNKIDIIQYLNKNFDYSDFDFYKFIESIQVTNKELFIVFEKDYIEGIFQIILEHIERIKHNTNIPIKAFNNKEGVLYIYFNSEHNKSLGQPDCMQTNHSSWIIVDEDKIKFIMKYFNKKLIPLFQKWKEDNENQFDPDNFTMIYVRNMKRVLATNFEKKNKNAMLQNKLYKYLKVNLKNFVSHHFV